MIEAAKIWNEPNNKSHWDLQLDPDWTHFATMAIAAGKAIRSAHPRVPRVLGGISPIDPHFMARMKANGVLDHVDAVAVHGFPLDWNLWKIDEWPAKLAEIQGIVPLPVWVTEVGVSSFGADEVQEWASSAQRSFWVAARRGSTGTASMTFHRHGKPQPGIRRPKAPRTIGISTWVFCGRTAPQNRRSILSPNTSASWACVSGFISRTTASTTLFAASETWACATCAPA
jgi:hypothetical protein